MKNKQYNIILNKTHISISSKTKKPMFINNISISQQKQQIHEI